MAVKNAQGMPRIEVRASITLDLHHRLVAECGLCGCHINGFITTAIAREIGARKLRRAKEADQLILMGQLGVEAVDGR
jgi:hypothetical protein